MAGEAAEKRSASLPFDELGDSHRLPVEALNLYMARA